MEKENKKGIVTSIYKLRKDFIIVGLTGRTGSGCTSVANLLTKEFAEIDVPDPNYEQQGMNNDDRKYSILYKFLKINWVKFERIKASDIILFFVLLEDFDNFIKSFADSNSLKEEPVNKSKNEVQNALSSLKEEFNEYRKKAIDIDNFLINRCSSKLKTEDELNNTLIEKIEGYINFFEQDIPVFLKRIRDKLEATKKKELFDVFQIWGNNIRKYGVIEEKSEQYSENSPSELAHKINLIVKMIRDMHTYNKVPTFIVIDALRNPYEVLYFRERYSAFYLMSVNTTEKVRKKKLYELGYRDDEIKKLDNKEYKNKNIEDIYTSQDIEQCVALSDIHIVHDEIKIERNYDLKKQIVHFMALMLHPGLVPPSPEERLMQIAYTAKLNSGCISRQVGAAVTDEGFSLKSIGWNTVPQGQTPCSLRNFFDLCNQRDLTAYSKYEKEQNDEKFKKTVEKCKEQYDDNLDGITLSYCFKDLYIAATKKDNQVHTRSLHAEENAFLQLAKYGSTGIKGGKLFTTASPCELCAKKAYQLGIKDIYYIDTYPGITIDHIFDCGVNKPSLHLFQGAIGGAYIQLYNPIIPLKDEIECLSGIKMKLINEDLDNNPKEQKNEKSSDDENPS